MSNTRFTFSLFTSLLIVACGGSGGGAPQPPVGGGPGTPPPPPPPADPAGGPLTVFYSQDSPSGAGEVQRTDQAFDTQARLEVGNQLGLDLDYLGNLYQIGFRPTDPGLRVFSQASRRPDLDSFDSQQDRLIAGPATQLISPFAVELIHREGLALVVDFTVGGVLVFSSEAAGNVAPITITDLPGAGTFIDLLYDDGADRLFVLSGQQRVVVINDYVADGLNGSNARILELLDDQGEAYAGPSRALAYQPDTDMLLVSSVGLASVDNDGQIHRYSLASVQPPGFVVADHTLEGPATLLESPTDLALNGSQLRVSDDLSGNGRLLIFNDYFAITDAGVEPDLEVLANAPSALALEPAEPVYINDVSDIDTPTPMLKLLALHDDFNGSVVEKLVSYSTADFAPLESFEIDGLLAFRSLDIDVLGNVHTACTDASFDGSLHVLNRGATTRTDEAFDADVDRLIPTQFTAINGIDVVSARGVTFVAENAAFNGFIHAVPMSGELIGNPIFSAITFGVPADLDYDETNDRLFVSLTNGTVAVFDNVLDGPSFPIEPDRVFSVEDPSAPGSGIQNSQTFSGIVYDALNDRVLLADPGVQLISGSLEDGRLFIVEGASAALGPVQASVQIAGSSTALGDPLDLAWDGVDLYVTDRNLGGALLRFDDLLQHQGAGVVNASPDLITEAPNVIAIVLVPTTLAPTEGGSILDH